MKLDKHFGQCSNILTFFFFFFTAKDKGEKKLFGFAFTPLMREDGTTLSDESHELYVYKVRQTLHYVKHINKIKEHASVKMFLLFNFILDVFNLFS